MPRRRQPRSRRRRACTVITSAAAASALVLIPCAARGQTSLTGSTIALKSNGSTTLNSNGYLGTYLTIPAGGATVKLTASATAAAGAPAAHMNLVIADSITGFTVNATSATNYATPNLTLPAGTYFVRAERDYAANGGASGAFTLNNLSVSTISGEAASFSNASTNTNALNAANTYIDNFRKGSASVAMSGPGAIPLLAGTPIQVDLARHAFNFGTAVSGNTPTEINNYLGSNGTTLQTNYQAKLNQNFNAIVPGNGGKWQNNEFTRDVVTMSGVDQALNYAQSHNMRARMHNLIWGKNSFNGQQPSWVLNSSNTGLLDQALAGNAAAGAELRGEISERIQYYLNATRAAKIVELDVYNESFHVPQYRTALGYDNVDGIASIHNEAAAAAPNVKMFTNDYNVFQDGGDAFANWYVNEIQSIRNAGGNVGGIGAQYYPNTTIGTANNQHNAARMYAVLQNLSVQGVPVALTEFGVKAGGEAIAPQVLEESMRLTFGTPNSTGFMMWGFWAGEGLFAPGSPLFDANWNITENGKKWQDLLGIADWDGNPTNGWDTNVAALADANGAINFKGFFGDYYLRGQTSGAYDMTLAKGTSNYSVAMAAPPTWSLWNATSSGNWSATANWTSGGIASSVGQTAYFGPAAAARAINADSPRTIGMLAFNSSNAYSINGSAAITLAGFNNASGHRAGIYVAAGSHSINAPLRLADDTTVTIASAADALTVSNLQPSTASITKRGGGTFVANNVRAAGLHVDQGKVRLIQSGGTSNVSDLAIAAGASLDLTNNVLVTSTAAGGAAAGIYSGVQGNVQRAYNFGSWDQPGLTTSMPDAGPAVGITTIGVATAERIAFLAPTETGTFAGQPVTGASTIAMYTYAGDLNFDGLVDAADYGVIDNYFQFAGTDGYANGDFNYDGIIDAGDYGIIDNTFQLQGAPLAIPSSPLTITAVPEPAACALVTLAALLGTRRRRRR